MSEEKQQATKKKSFRPLAWLAWLGLTVCGLLMCVVLVVLGVVGTEGGRTWLSHFAIDTVNDSGLAKIELTGLKFPSLGQIDFNTLKVYQNEQLLLSVANFELLWQPAELWSKRVVVDHIRSSTMDVYPPKTQKEKAAEPPKENSGVTLIPVFVNELTLSKVTIHDVALPKDQVLPPFGIDGQAVLFDQHPILVDLTLQTHSDKSTIAKINSTAASLNDLNITATITEPANGLIGKQLQLPVAQDLSIALDMAVQHRDQVFDIVLNAFELPIYKHQINIAGQLFLDLANQHYETDALTIQTDQQVHTLKARYKDKLATADLRLDQFPLTLSKPWVAALESGQLSTDLSLTWAETFPGKFPKGKGRIELTTVYDTLPIELTSTQAFQYPLITLSETNIKVKKAHLTASGTVDLKGNSNNVQVRMSHFDTALLAPFDLPIPKEVSARVPSLTASVTQSIKQPNIDLSTRVLGKIADQAFDANIQSKLTPDYANIQAFDFKLANSALNAKGKVDWKSDQNDFRVTHKSIDNQIIELAKAFAEFEFPSNINFSSDGTTHIKGSLKKPSVTTQTQVAGTFSLEGQALPFQFKTQSDVAFKSSQNWIFKSDSTSLVINQKDVLRINGQAAPENFQFQVQLIALPTELLSIIGLPAINGQANANLMLSGSLDQPMMAGKIQYKDTVQVSKKQNDPVVWDLNFSTPEQVLTVESTVKQRQIILSQLTISLPLQPVVSAIQAQKTVPVDIKIQGQQDLRVAKWFLDPAIHPLGGIVQTDLHITGDVQQPKVSGWAKIDKAHYANTISGIQFEDILGELKLNQEQLQIEKLSAKTANKGSIRVDGFVALRAPSTPTEEILNLDVVAKDAMIIEQPGIQAQLSGTASAKGNLNEIWVKGDLELTPLNINIDEIDTSSIPKIKVTEVSDIDDQTKNKSKMPTIHLDILTQAKQQAYLRGRGLETELGGEIKITGTASKPKYVGKFVTRRGKMELFGKKFVLKDGEVQFANQAVGLNIPGEYTGKDIDISLLIYGTTEKPKISLSSNPPLPEDEILSRIIFGKSAQNITPFQAIRLASAVKTLSQGGGFDPVDKAREKLGLDSINIENEETENGSGLSVGVGKYINERVYLELIKTSDINQPWAAAVQIEVSPRITLESTTGSQGDNNTKLLWRKDY